MSDNTALLKRDKLICYRFRLYDLLNLAKHNAQYEPVTISQSSTFHDRFLLVDDTVYHIGASLKDLGKKLFAFSKMEIKPIDILKNV